MATTRAARPATASLSIAVRPAVGIGSIIPSSSGRMTVVRASTGESPWGHSHHFSTSRPNMGQPQKTGTPSSLSSRTEASGAASEKVVSWNHWK